MHITSEIILKTTGTVVAAAIVIVGVVLGIRRSQSPAALALKLAFSVPFVVVCFWVAVQLGPYGPFLMVAMAVVLSILWTPHIARFVVNPLLNAFDGGSLPPEEKPYYSVAMTKRNRGQPREAVAEIRRQLTRFPNDFEGIMMLARIQTEDLADLAGAENTLHHFCEPPNAPQLQVAAAYTQLADWHLKVADADAARLALQKIIERYPGTETALQAEQRIAHLVEAEKLILAQHDRQNMAVPEGVKNVGLLDSSTFLQAKEIEPGRLAAAYVKHLEAHPNDVEVREKLALIYARDFQRLDLATMELKPLIEEPRHKPKQVAHWLNLLANLQVELGADPETVKATLQIIVDRFPDLPLAEVAQKRIGRLENEFRGRKQATRIKLGTYEQNIGLKYGRPGKPSE